MGRSLCALEPTFTGTNIEKLELLEWLRGGYSVSDFLSTFRGVRRDECEEVRRDYEFELGRREALRLVV